MEDYLGYINILLGAFFLLTGLGIHKPKTKDGKGFSEEKRIFFVIIGIALTAWGIFKLI